MILLTNDDFYALQLCFSSFFDWRDPKSTNCKKLDFKTFLEKMRFFAICGFEKIDQKQSRRSLRSSLHNELSPFIHEVKLGVHIVCEHPPWYYKRKCKEKM